MTKEREMLVKEHSALLGNLESLEIIPEDDPDLLRMEEIMKELKKVENDES